MASDSLHFPFDYMYICIYSSKASDCGGYVNGTSVYLKRISLRILISPCANIEKCQRISDKKEFFPLYNTNTVCGKNCFLKKLIDLCE